MRRPARVAGRSLSRWARFARFRPGHDRRAGRRARRRAGSRAVVPHQERRARMGTPLWTRLARLRPRPFAFSYRRGEDGGRRRLGPGRRTEEPGVERSLGASRDQGAARCPPSQPRRAGHAHAMPAALEPSAPRPARDADPLAHRRKEQQRRPLRPVGARRAVLARHPRPLPGRGPGAKLYRGGQS